MTRRKHRRVSRAVDAWVDGELDVATARHVATHVRDCWGCSVAAETARLIKEALAMRAGREPPWLAAARLQRFVARITRA